jgi:hypothetical protein
MPQVSSFSSCKLLGMYTHNMYPNMYYMVQYISIELILSQNPLLSMELLPIEVNWCQNFTLHCLAYKSLIQGLFGELNSSLEISP